MKTFNKSDMISAPEPAKTYSYQPVSNGILFETIEEKLYKHNLPIVKERFDSNSTRSQMFGVYTIGDGNEEQQMNIGFRNSYDKSLAVGLVAGSTVIVCSNLMFKGDIKILRKHTNGVFNDLENLIEKVISNSLQQFDALQEDSQKMKQIWMSTKEMAELTGRMFINDNIITATQLGVIKKEIHFSESFTDPTLWSFYNHCTEALKIAHPTEVMQSHIKLHDYVLELV